VLLLPAVFLALIVPTSCSWSSRSTRSTRAPAVPNKNVVGYPLFPVYVAKAGGFFFIVFGITTLLAAIFQINPIWVYGSYDPSPVSSGAQPDWYMGSPTASRV